MTSFARVHAVIALTATLCSACTGSIARLPTDRVGRPRSTGVPFTEAAGGCFARLRVAGRVDVAGAVGGRSVRAQLRFAVMMAAAARLESVEGTSRRPFVLSVQDEDATLFLPAQNLVLAHERASSVLDAAFGLPIEAATLERLLACPTGGSGSGGPAEDLGDGWARQHWSGRDGALVIYLRQDRPASAWRLVAILGRAPSGAGWRADYADLRNGSWRKVRLMSVDPTGVVGRQYDISLTISDLELSPVIGRASLAATFPPSAERVTVGELRRSGSLLSAGSR